MKMRVSELQPRWGFRRRLFHRLRQALGLIFSLLVAHSAMAQKITMEFDQSVDFSKFKTFAIRDGELNSKNPALNSTLVKKQIDNEIKRSLEARGQLRFPDRPI